MGLKGGSAETDAAHMLWLILVVVGLIVAARPLVRVYRSAMPDVAGSWDASAAPTAFDEGLRSHLSGAGFDDVGARLVRISGFSAVMHLWRRPDGTVVTGMTLPDGTVPAHYVTTVLGEGRGWLESRTTDRTPGPREALTQVIPEATLEELLVAHDRALGAIAGLGVSTVRSIDPLDVHRLQGMVSRRSLRHNPLRWLVGLVAKTLAPDRPREVVTGPRLDRRLRSLRLALT